MYFDLKVKSVDIFGRILLTGVICDAMKIFSVGFFAGFRCLSVRLVPWVSPLCGCPVESIDNSRPGPNMKIYENLHARQNASQFGNARPNLGPAHARTKTASA